jgi:hypothetical protein
MTVITIFLIALICFLTYLSIIKFNEHCEKKFNYKFFTASSFFWVLIITLLLYFGIKWAKIGVEPNLNGIALIVIGAFVAIYLIFINFKNTNIIYGFIGTIIQFCFFGFIAQLSIPLLIFAVIGFILKLFPKENIVINHYFK